MIHFNGTNKERDGWNKPTSGHFSKSGYECVAPSYDKIELVALDEPSFWQIN